MRMTYVVHILAGGLALVFGYVALYAAKRAPLHRRSGMAFVYAMLTMCFSTTPCCRVGWLDPGLMLVALAVGLTSLTFGFEALANGGKRNGMPAFPFFMFGVVGLWRCSGPRWT